jgi:hypothetical protein
MMALIPQAGEQDAALRSDPLLLKFAHFIAGRPDLLRDEYLGLVALPDSAPSPLSAEEVQALLVEAWGERSHRRIEAVATRPHAARVLDQSHAVRLRDGRAGEVRIWRPDAAALLGSISVRRDALSALAQRCCSVGPPRLDALVDAFEPWLAAQMPSAAGVGRVRLTAGAPRTALADLRHVSSRTADGAVELVFRQAFERRRGQEAPHAANLGTGGGRAPEWLTDRRNPSLTALGRQHLRDLWSGLVARDEPRALSAVRHAVQGDAESNWSALEREIREAMRRGTATGRTERDAPKTEGDDFDELLLATLRAIARCELELAAGPLAAHRMMLATCLALRRLPGRGDSQRSVRHWLARTELREAIDAIEPEAISRMASGLGHLAREGPERLVQILDDLADGSLGVTLTFDETPRVAAAWTRRIRLIATAIASLGPWFVLARLIESRGLTAPVVLATAALLVMLHLWIVKQWRSIS